MVVARSNGSITTAEVTATLIMWMPRQMCNRSVTTIKQRLALFPNRLLIKNTRLAIWASGVKQRRYTDRLVRKFIVSITTIVVKFSQQRVSFHSEHCN